MPSLVVMLGRSAPVADVDTVATLMLVVLAAASDGFSGDAWNRHDTGGDRTDRVRLAALVVSHTHVVFNNMEDQGQPTARSLMDVMGILPPARQMAGVRRGLKGAPMAIRPSERSILNRAASCAATATLVLVIGIVHAADAPSGVVVNGQALPAATVRSLEQAYRVPIAPGRYWYDAVSGAWGREGGPIAGQMMPALRLGGPLAPDASRGNSQVFINGRELMAGEVWALQQACRTPVLRGRYWVNSLGVGGVEGGPAIFNLAACGQSSGKSGGSSTRTYCDSGGNCSSHGLWGWIGTTR
jgi:hypothetical protein